LQFRILELAGYLAPTSAYPTAAGTVMIECRHPDGGILSANIRNPKEAELLYRLPGFEPKFEVFPIHQ
jgi:hypothetical protein